MRVFRLWNFGRLKSLLFLSTVCFLLIPAISSSQNGKDCCCKRRDIVFIIDQSGSMLSTDSYRLRWDISNYIINKLDTTTTVADRVSIIPFGGREVTSSYARESRPHGPNGRWFDLAYQSDLQELRDVIELWFDRKDRRYHSKTTDILSAFGYFEREVDQPNASRDLFIFFISDGLVDLFDPDRPDEPYLTRRHNEQLLALLNKHSNRWRLYNICIGTPDSVDISIHKRMLDKISITTRLSGAIYPAFANNEPNYPYLLVVNSADKIANLLKMKQGIDQILDRGSSLEQISRITSNNNSIEIPGRSSAALRLKFTVLPKVTAQQFVSRLIVNFSLGSKLYRPAKVELKIAEDRLLASYFDFAIDEDSLINILRNANKKIEDIKSWQIGVETSGLRFEILNLEVSYEHGWRFVIDRLFVETAPKSWWNFFRWLFDRSPSCKSILRIHSIVENQCGPPLINSNAIMEFANDNLEHSLQVKKVPNEQNRVGEKYELTATIDNAKLFKDKLGEKLNIMVTFPANRYIFQTNTVPVQVCAEYPELD